MSEDGRAGTVEVELHGTGEPILDGGAELLFTEEFRREFTRRMTEWAKADPEGFWAAAD